ncbi:hypothetical protein BAUCODRAFT_445025 [Baudoinia panamericana UAMH 10762]|uniref:Uncharacterized protein n=1 Tax=Baudoinia panamericana (strain UAMH 10762) TaxID=717646 RepID=M2LS08_BAUPA|nr:uncharacterized protein BAUCODRAFT_445025 [Baudoinia panamericana UAMH 10762]EMC97252.1 hypothetical protein BAUCODRAFT_445025 [Baudoinia panamericana UAMH 10762]
MRLGRPQRILANPPTRASSYYVFRQTSGKALGTLVGDLVIVARQANLRIVANQVRFTAVAAVQATRPPVDKQALTELQESQTESSCGCL